jgi:hypothetical protein
LVLECRFLSRPERIAAQLYDAEPINENELTTVLNELSTQAKKAGSFHVVLIGSPTGWTERAVSLVTQKTPLKGFRDRRAAVVLWDLHTEKVFMDTSDERLWAFWVLVAPKEYAAKVSDCVARIREVLARRNSLPLAEAKELCGADASWVRGAFTDLVRAGGFIVDQLPETDWVVSHQSS